MRNTDIEIMKIERLKRIISGLSETPTVNEIEEIICDFGLVFHDYDIYGEFTRYMNNDRMELGVYQTPRQFAPCIVELLKHKIDSYIEIGLFSGGSYLIMTEFLKLKNPSVITVGVDISSIYMRPGVIPYINNLHIGTSADFKGKSFDLAFIDGDHFYRGIVADWENVGKYAKITMIHDINDRSCPDVVRFWNEIKQGRKTMEFKYQTKGMNVHGIGLIFNR